MEDHSRSPVRAPTWSPEDAVGFSPPISPVYQPTSGPWATGNDNLSVVTFGPGVQLEHNSTAAMEDITAQVTRMDIDAPGFVHEQHLCFSEQVFSDVQPAVLEPPARQHRQPPSRAQAAAAPKTNTAQRASSRLAARPSSIPVSKRAQHRLIRELDFINKDERIGEDVVSAYIDSSRPTRAR